MVLQFYVVSAHFKRLGVKEQSELITADGLELSTAHGVVRVVVVVVVAEAAVRR